MDKREHDEYTGRVSFPSEIVSEVVSAGYYEGRASSYDNTTSYELEWRVGACANDAGQKWVAASLVLVELN